MPPKTSEVLISVDSPESDLLLRTADSPESLDSIDSNHTNNNGQRHTRTVNTIQQNSWKATKHNSMKFVEGALLAARAQ